MTDETENDDSFGRFREMFRPLMEKAAQHHVPLHRAAEQIFANADADAAIFAVTQFLAETALNNGFTVKDLALMLAVAWDFAEFCQQKHSDPGDRQKACHHDRRQESDLTDEEVGEALARVVALMVSEPKGRA